MMDNYDLQQKMLKELGDQYRLYAISQEATIARIKQLQVEDEDTNQIMELLTKLDHLKTAMYDIDCCRTTYLCETGRLN